MIKIGLIGDIVGKNARSLIAKILPQIKQQYGIDFIVANAENASHGFGLSIAHAQFLMQSGINVLTGGNHSFDKKEITSLFQDSCFSQYNNPVLRPHNFSHQLPGSGVFVTQIYQEKLAVLNLMGHFGMPHCDNVFLCAQEQIAKFKLQGIQNIIIDMHAEATSEKRTLFEMFKGEVSVIFGTHTHIGTDDLMIEDGSFYVSDVGMCGGFDSVIGMENNAPIKRALTGISSAKFEVSKSEKTIFQMIICSLLEGHIQEAYKIRYIQTIGWLPQIDAIKIKK